MLLMTTDGCGTLSTRRKTFPSAAKAFTYGLNPIFRYEKTLTNPLGYTEATHVAKNLRGRVRRKATKPKIINLAEA
jgi:hypothetical protein